MKKVIALSLLLCLLLPLFALAGCGNVPNEAPDGETTDSVSDVETPTAGNEETTGGGVEEPEPFDPWFDVYAPFEGARVEHGDAETLYLKSYDYAGELYLEMEETNKARATYRLDRKFENGVLVSAELRRIASNKLYASIFYDEKGRPSKLEYLETNFAVVPLHTRYFEYDDQNRLIKTREYSNGRYASSCALQYDQQGNLIKRGYYSDPNEDTEPNFDTMKNYHTYAYDEKCNLIHYAYYSENVLIGETEYHPDGREMKSTSYYKGELNTTTEFEYDGTNLIKVTEKSADGKRENRTEYVYGEDGSKQCAIYSNGGLQYQYEWNANGDRIKQVTAMGQNYYYDYEFDENGRLLSETRKRQSQEIKLVHQYDERDNCIRTDFYKNGDHVLYTAFEYDAQDHYTRSVIYSVADEVIEAYDGGMVLDWAIGADDYAAYFYGEDGASVRHARFYATTNILKQETLVIKNSMVNHTRDFYADGTLAKEFIPLENGDIIRKSYDENRWGHIRTELDKEGTGTVEVFDDSGKLVFYLTYREGELNAPDLDVKVYDGAKQLVWEIDQAKVAEHYDKNDRSVLTIRDVNNQDIKITQKDGKIVVETPSETK